MNNKTDKGFELNYWKLSYRRKFIRTLWVTPFMLAVIVSSFVLTDNKIIQIAITLGLPIIFFSQLLYTYRKWKKSSK